MDTHIHAGYIPGAIGRITELHGTYYHTHWGFHLFFEAKVASELAAFLSRFTPEHDGFWLALVGQTIAGAIAIDGSEATVQVARLRWFIVAPEYHGTGIGKKLMNTALDFCQQASFQKVYLTTFSGLDTARHLYEQAGFVCVEERVDTHWGNPVTEQTFELVLSHSPSTVFVQER